jgi:hypothetical protein
MTLSLTFVYIVIAALLLWFVITSKGHWFLKLLSIGVALAFSFFSYQALGSTDGWPAHTLLPPRALFVSAEIIQPTGSDPGRIYLWLIPPRFNSGLFGYKPGRLEPRSYLVPYSLPLQGVVERAQQLTGQGQLVELRTEKTRRAGNGNGGRGGHTHGGRRGGHSGGQSTSTSSSQQRIGIYVLPRSTPPQKQ